MGTLEGNVSFRICVADLAFEVRCVHSATERFCREYLTDKAPVQTIAITPADIEQERQRLLRKKNPGEALEASSPEALERLHLCRRIAELLPQYDRVLFHGSSLSIDGTGVLFTAKSGTGKSTHTRLWRQVFGDRVRMVNDDKPFLHIGADAVIAMHTHCPQGYEVYKGCPIVYSMGNFFFPSRKSPARTWFHGYMTVLDISAENISFEIIPYRFDSEKHHVLDGEEKEEFMRYINYLCEPICDKKRIADYFDAWSVYRGLNASLRHMHFTPEIQEGAPETLAQLKNLMCCEAHNELAKNTMKLVHDRRIEDAKKLVPEIEKLRNMEL